MVYQYHQILFSFSISATLNNHISLNIFLVMYSHYLIASQFNLLNILLCFEFNYYSFVILQLSDIIIL